jgi:hypothetical protein
MTCDAFSQLQGQAIAFAHTDVYILFQERRTLGSILNDGVVSIESLQLCKLCIWIVKRIGGSAFVLRAARILRII